MMSGGLDMSVGYQMSICGVLCTIMMALVLRSAADISRVWSVAVILLIVLTLRLNFQT